MSRCDSLSQAQVGLGVWRVLRCPESAVLRVITPAPEPRPNVFDYCPEHVSYLVPLLARVHGDCVIRYLREGEKEQYRIELSQGPRDTTGILWALA